jgi:hypothetical protein
MRVNQRQARFLLRQVLERGNQRSMFEHVGVVAGVEGVTVTEHGGMVTGRPCTRAMLAKREGKFV